MVGIPVRFGINFSAFVLFGLAAVAVTPAATAGGGCPIQVTTCITVDWALDPVPDSLTHSCTYTSGAFFFPSADGRCTIRRALREAGARPAGDRPILIRFTGLATGGAACTDGSQDSCDDSQYDAVNDQWRLFVDGNSDRFKLGDVGVGITLGQVVIRGPELLANGMPKVFLDGTDLATGDNNPYTMAIHMTNNVIERLGFLRGADYIQIQDGMNNQTIRTNTFGLHPDGDQIEHIDPDDLDPFVGASSLAGNNGIFVKQNTDTVTIEDNFFAGMEVAAIQVEDLTTNIVIQNNHVGTRIDGTVPVIPDLLQCNVYDIPPPDPNSLDPNSWYGGDGIAVNGTGALIDNNVIAGLHTHRSGGVKEPVAIEAFGNAHTVQFNLIGMGQDGYAAGICGEAIQFGGAMDDNHMILDNEINRARMTINFDGPINWIDTTQTNIIDGGTTVRRNIVTDAPAPPPTPPTEKVYEMGPNIQPSIKGFEPAEITSISGTAVEGQACPGSPCANCIIDLYKDDDDGRNEALEHLGSAIADASGDFMFTLAAPLDPGFGIRTMTTSVAQGQIGNTAAGTTSEESSDDPFDMCAGLYLPGCPMVLNLTGTISGMQQYTAESITTANATFDGTAEVTMTASTTIGLGNGTVFESGSSASLLIDAGACP